MQIIIRTTFLLFAFFLATAAFGQVGKVEGRLDVEEVENRLTVTGWCHNFTGEDKQLSYKLSFLRTDADGNRSSSQQSNSFELAAGNGVQLASTTMNLGPEAEMTIVLEIREGNQLLDRVTYPETNTEEPPPPSSIDTGGGEEGLEEQEDNPDPRLAADEVEFGGLVFEQTKTVWGQQFFQLFIQRWQAAEMTGDFNLVVEEVPFRGRTTLVKLILNDEPILIRTLQGKYDYLEELADLAVQVAVYQVQQLNQVAEDLDADLSGSGIY
jgi:hypothetical protein